MTDKITLLMLSWRDIRSPKHGGAEVFTHETLSRLDNNKFNIIHFSPLFKGCEKIEIIENVKYLRKGNLISVIFHAIIYYHKNKKNIDFVIDQCNTHRFFTPLWVGRKKRVFLIYQLTREIWKIQSKFPLSFVGKVLETPMLKLNRKDYTVTISESTKNDLVSVGFNKNKIKIIPIGLGFEPWIDIKTKNKEVNPTFIYVGRFAKYKGIDVTFQAFAAVKKKYINAKLWIVGKKDIDYIKKSLLSICSVNNLTYGNSNENKDILFWDYVPEKDKLDLQSRAWALIFPSIREGWGIIITEAAAVGTPSIVYNSPGSRDAVNYGSAGYLCNENNVGNISNLMLEIIENQTKYKEVCLAAYKFSKNFNWDRSAKIFEEFIIGIKE